MPRSSRHKSHKQSKHREHSVDSGEDSKKVVKERNGKEESSVRVPKDLSSIGGGGEKRKSSASHSQSQSREGKDLSSHGNGDALDEFVASKRRKDRAEVGGGGDRWNGGGDERGDVVVVDKEAKGESSWIDSAKSKVLIESKSKSSRRHDGSEKKEDNVGLVMEKEENKSGKIESKRKPEKDRPEKEKEKLDRDTIRKEVSQYKEAKEKERGLERDRKVQDSSKRELEARPADGEAKRKQGSQLVDAEVEHKVKRGTENTERPLQEELRNHDFEKEAEKRIKRKGDLSGEKDKYQDDKRDSDDRRLSSRGERDKDGRYKDEWHTDGSYKDERHKDERPMDGSYKDARHTDVSYKDARHTDGSYKDERHKDGSYREKYRDDLDRDSRHRDGKQKEDIDREKRHRADKYKDERASRDCLIDKSDSKHLRDEIDAAESRNKKSRTESSNRDGSPIYDDRSTRYKDDRGKRRSDDKEVASDLRSRSVKEQRSDLEKKPMSSSKAEPVADRERPRSRLADMDAPMNHNRRRNSPSSSSLVAKDQYRYSKPAESKYRDVVHEERAQHYVSSAREVAGGSGVPQKANLSRSTDKFIQKEDGHIGGSSAERRINSDTRSSPMQLMEKSPSSSSTDRRHLNRSGVRRNLDVEDSGQRSGGSRDLKDYSCNEGKGSQDLPMDSYSMNEHSQADGENMSVSSPFIRTSYLPGHPKSLLPPPPPFRSGADSSSGFGSYEDDNRGKPNNRFKRIGDSNMGRLQGNSWKGVQNWPSPVPNGFMPFQHGPPPVGFHPVMQQFSAPPMFGVRPSIELNHPGVPFHYSDADRFSSHGRSFGWRNPVDDSCPPPLQGWDSNNGAVVDGSHMYGRLDWDHSRTIMSSGAWETSVDMWKGQNAGMTMKSPYVPKEENTVNTVDEILADQLSQQAENEQNQLDLQPESIGINHSGNILANDSFEAPKSIPEKRPETSKISRDDDVHLTHIYLSKLDVSADLIPPELYTECAGLMHVKQNAIDDVDASSFVDVEGTNDRVKISSKASNASLFAVINDSIFKRAISLYKKQRDEMMATFLPFLSNGGKVPFPNAANLEFVSTSDEEDVTVPIPFPDEDVTVPIPFPDEDVTVPIPFLDEDAQGMLVSTSDIQEAESSIPTFNQENEETAIALQKLEEPLPILNDKEDAPIPTQMPEKSVEEPIPTLNEVKMEVDLPFDQEMSKDVENEPSTLVSKVQSTTNSPTKTEITNMASDTSNDHSASRIKEEKLVDTICGPLLCSTMASEAVMPVLNDFESENLSRIHHMPESTH